MGVSEVYQRYIRDVLRKRATRGENDVKAVRAVFRVSTDVQEYFACICCAVEATRQDGIGAPDVKSY